MITFEGEQVAGEEELFFEVGPRTHGSGRFQHSIEAHRHELLKHYDKEVVQHLGPVDEALILGSGEAKHELHQSIEHHKGLRGKVVAVYGTSRLTKHELMDEAERFFALDIELGGSRAFGSQL
jgi:hypothetical protein